MINITSIKNINNLSDYEKIIPSNYDLYYKELFVNENITFNTVRNFLINNYDGKVKINDVNIKGTLGGDKNRRTTFRFAGAKEYGTFRFSWIIFPKTGTPSPRNTTSSPLAFNFSIISAIGTAI